jgi:hypothetical protein
MRILNLWIRDLESLHSGYRYGMEKFTGIRDKHPGSATLLTWKLACLYRHSIL